MSNCELKRNFVENKNNHHILIEILIRKKKTIKNMRIEFWFYTCIYANTRMSGGQTQKTTAFHRISTNNYQRNEFQLFLIKKRICFSSTNDAFSRCTSATRIQDQNPPPVISTRYICILHKIRQQWRWYQWTWSKHTLC